MKKIFSVLCALILSVTISFSLFGCDSETDPSPKPPISATVNTTRYKVDKANENPYGDPISFKDDKNYYYMFYLGDLRGIPLQNNVDVLEYNGIDSTHSVTTSITNSNSIEKQVTTAIEHCTEWTHAWSVSLSKSIGTSVKVFDLINLSTSNSLELGYSGSVKNSDKTTATESYKEAQSYTKEHIKTESIAFNSNYEHGFYRYILMGELNVYGVVIYDIANKTYSLTNYPVLAASYYTWDFCATSAQFNTDNYEVLPFELNEQYIKNLPIPTENIKTNPVFGQTKDIVIDYEMQSCLLDNGFDPSESGTEKDKLAHSTFKLFDLVLMNAAEGVNGYYIPNGKQLKLNLKVLQNPSKLPTGSHLGAVNWTVHNISDDSYDKVVYGTNISGKKIHSGAYYVKITYTDGTFDEFHTVDFLNGAKKNNLISLDFKIDNEKVLKSMEVVIVYELYYDYMRHIFNWGGTKRYANWRCLATLQFGAI